jgi:CubicO group peptidase (beta-lactamase class C family)
MMMTAFLVRLAAIGIICSGCANLRADDIRRGVNDQLVQVIDAAVQQQIDEQQLTGVAVGVLRDGRLVFTKGYGLADRANNIAVTSETVFNWASNSKPVVAVVAMQLVEFGKLDLDADIRKYVPEYPPKSHTVTTRQLLRVESNVDHSGTR